MSPARLRPPQFWTLRYVDAATYQILGNLKIVTTGVLLWACLRRPLSLLQGLALMLLMIGATISQARTAPRGHHLSLLVTIRISLILSIKRASCLLWPLSNSCRFVVETHRFASLVILVCYCLHFLVCACICVALHSSHRIHRRGKQKRRSEIAQLSASPRHRLWRCR